MSGKPCLWVRSLRAVMRLVMAAAALFIAGALSQPEPAISGKYLEAAADSGNQAQLVSRTKSSDSTSSWFGAILAVASTSDKVLPHAFQIHIQYSVKFSFAVAQKARAPPLV